MRCEATKFTQGIQIAIVKNFMFIFLQIKLAILNYYCYASKSYFTNYLLLYF